MNKHIVEISDYMTTRYSVDALNMTTSEWICANTKHKNKPFNFHRFPFQKKIVDDLSESLSCIKCSQVGLTEIQLRKALAMAYRRQGLSIGYSMPDEELRAKVSSTRMNPILEDNPIFNPTTSTKPLRSKEVKQISKSFIHFFLANESGATSTPLDILLVDEVDLSDQAMITLFNSRLQAAEAGNRMRQDFSTPTFEEYGISASYNLSNQQEFFCKCDACGHQQIPDFERRFVHIPGLNEGMSLMDIEHYMIPDLDLNNAYIRCEKCQARLNLDRPDREWVALYPTRTGRSGYRVRPFCTSTINISYIIGQMIDYKRNEFIRGFYNTVLGKEYKDSNTRLEEAKIRAVMVNPAVPYVSKDKPVFVGIDVGQVCHITLLTPDELGMPMPFLFDTCKANNLIDYVKDLEKKYNIVQGAIDRYPYTPLSEDVFSASKGKIWPVAYSDSQAIRLRENDAETPYYSGNRTMMLDKVQKNVNEATWKIRGYGEKHEHDLITHLRDMIREESPEKPATWKKLTNTDHFFHALAFGLFSIKIAEYILDNMPVEDQDPRSCIVIGGVQEPSSGNILGVMPRENNQGRPNAQYNYVSL